MPLVTRTCPCGKSFEVPEYKVRQGRGKRCSKACQYTYATRPSGLTYQKHKENPTSFKPGVVPWNKDLALKDEITYRELHRWVARRKQKTGLCKECGTEGFTEWANISREYYRDLSDWQEMCRPCHRNYDSGEFRGLATAKFGRDQVQNG